VVCFRTDQEDDHLLPADAGSGECAVAVGYLGVILDMITQSVRRPLRKPAATRSLSRRRMERNKMAGQMAKRVGRARTSRDWRRAYQEPGGDGDIQPEHLSGKVRVSSQGLWSASGKGIRKGILVSLTPILCWWSLWRRREDTGEFHLWRYGLMRARRALREGEKLIQQSRHLNYEEETSIMSLLQPLAFSAHGFGSSCVAFSSPCPVFGFVGQPY
jgi:hypothetical protein